MRNAMRVRRYAGDMKRVLRSGVVMGMLVSFLAGAAMAGDDMRVNVTAISSGLGLADVVVESGSAVEVRRADGSVIRCVMMEMDGAAHARVMVSEGDAAVRVVRDGTVGGWQHLKTQAAMQTPDWAKGATWYQIFPERFANGNEANDPGKSSSRAVGASDVVMKQWESAWYPGDMREEANIVAFGREVFKRRYGGDLEGVVAKLDHLRSLGVNAIYLNPIFDAQSLHKYDARDFRHVDPTLAGDGTVAKETGDPHEVTTWAWTSADRYFVDVLLPACKKRGIRVVIDGVFNHVGREHWAFQDVVKRGRSSAYADWFVCEFDHEGKLTGWQAWDKKDGWLPEFRQVKGGLSRDRDETVVRGDLNSGAKKHILDITRRWMDPNGDGDGSEADDDLGALVENVQLALEKAEKKCFLAGEGFYQILGFIQGCLRDFHGKILDLASGEVWGTGIPVDMLGEHRVAIEVEVGTEGSARNHARQPVDVVGPHFMVGNGINRRPDRKGFVGFDEGSGEGIGCENGAVEAVAIDELKMEFSTGLDSVRCDPDLFLGLTHGAFVRFLAEFDAAAGGVDFSGPETALFTNE